MKKALYLRSIAQDGVIKHFLELSLSEMMGVTGKYTMVAFSYPGWPTADYISKLACQISDEMYKTGFELAQAKYKNFDPEKTKLTPEIVEEIWQRASNEISKAIHEGFEGDQKNRIPGLGKSIDEGAIIALRSHIDLDEMDTEEAIKYMDRAREEMKKKLEDADYRDEMLRCFRNSFFNYLKENYGLYDEVANESVGELKQKIR